MHFLNPVAQAVHDELQHTRMPHVKRIPRTCVVHVVARTILPQPVVNLIVDSAEGECRPELIAFRGVVVHNVENHLDTSGVQRFHHRLEFVHRPACRVTRLRGKKADRVIAPIVAQSFFDQPAIIDKAVHRHELNRRDAKLGQIVDDRCRGQPRIRSAKGGGHIGMAHRESSNVGLVDDALVPRNSGRLVSSPGECRIDDNPLQHSWSAVTAVE